MLGPGKDIVFGEEGSNTVYVTADGVRDEIYCGEGPNDTIVFVGGRGDANIDYIANCEIVETQ